jgi:hypothetical protein
MQRFSIIITRILLASECDTVCRGARCKWLWTPLIAFSRRENAVVSIYIQNPYSKA